MNLLGYHIPSLAIVAVTWVSFYKAFATIDKDQSDDQRRFFKDWLLGIHGDDRRWAYFFTELFTTLFGKKHFSLRCARRSFMLSAILIFLVYVILGIRHPQPIRTGNWLANFMVFIIFFAASLIPGSIADYFSLWKTRLLLTKTRLFRSAALSLVVLMVDFMATTIFFSVSYVAVSFCYALYVANGDLWWYIFLHPYRLIPILSGPELREPAWLLYLTALLTSAWLWVYVGVAYLLRFTSYVPRLLKLLGRFIDFENHPVRTIGYVAATVSASLVAIYTVI
jgi:hypothetical protein